MKELRVVKNLRCRGNLFIKELGVVKGLWALISNSLFLKPESPANTDLHVGRQFFP